MRPYLDFDDLRRDALDLWRVYVEILNPARIQRVAVRYINHLGLPTPVTDLARYLTAPPALPPGVQSDQRIVGFFAC